MTTFFTLFLFAGFIITFIFTPINRFIIDASSIDDYDTKELKWFESVYSIGYEKDIVSIVIKAIAVSLLIYFYNTEDLSFSIVLMYLALAYVSAQFISNTFSLSKHATVRSKKHYIIHNFWLYLDALFSTIPFLVFLTRTGLQKRLIFHYIMAVDRFDIYIKYIKLFSDKDRERIKSRMVGQIPLYKNYFKVLSESMKNSSNGVVKLLDYMQGNDSLSVQFLPKSNNFLSTSFEEYVKIFGDNSGGVCNQKRSFVAAQYFGKGYERTREDIFGNILKSTFQDIFGIDLIQLTYAPSELKLVVEYTLVDRQSTFSSPDSRDVCYVAPSILWSIKLQSSKEVFFQTQIATEPYNNIQNVANIADFYNKIAQTHYINLSKKLLTSFGIEMSQKKNELVTTVGLSEEKREELLEKIEEYSGEYGEDFLEIVAEDFYSNNEDLISTVFMLSSSRLALKHGNYEDIASGLLSDTFEFDAVLESLWD